MDPDFWHSRWQERRIGFHQDRPTPFMVRYWPTLGIPAGTRVFVPLCGKSLDMGWLASQGFEVLGVELSETAVREFFEEHGLEPTVHETSNGLHFRAGAVEIVCGDAFALDPALLAGCGAVLDRAALIALPADMRRRYVDTVHARLPRGCRGLVVTLEYPQHEKAGPPFAVDATEIDALFARDWNVRLLDRRDILDLQPGFVAEGVTSLHAAVYRLERR